MSKLLVFFKANKEAKNAFWLIGGRIIQMVISLFVGIITARYLGPSNYGVLNYGASYVIFFTAISNLGINSIIVKELVDSPSEEGEIIGTSLGLRFLSSTLSCVLIFCIVSVLDVGEAETITAVLLYSLSLVFQIFETFNFWFQAKYQSDRTAVTVLVAYIATAIYKIALLIANKSVVWFAFANSVDLIAYAIIIVWFYKKEKGPRPSFSRKRALQLLSSSHHFILSGLMVSIYGYIGNVMLKQMLNSEAVGYYSTAIAVCGMWTFVLQAVIDAMYPTIMRLHKEDYAAFERKNRQLYAIVFYISVGVAVFITLFSKWIILILYGNEFIGAANPLIMASWYTPFSYLGSARGAWIVSENKQRYLKYIYFFAAIMNILFNWLLIPFWGASGVAIASLLTQVCTCLILPACIKPLRANTQLMIEAISLRKTFSRRSTR